MTEGSMQRVLPLLLVKRVIKQYAARKMITTDRSVPRARILQVPGHSLLAVRHKPRRIHQELSQALHIPSKQETLPEVLLQQATLQE